MSKYAANRGAQSAHAANSGSQSARAASSGIQGVPMSTKRPTNAHAASPRDRVTPRAQSVRASTSGAQSGPVSTRRAEGALAAFPGALGAMFALCLAVCLAIFAASPLAWADESDTLEGNTVNARQTADNSFLYDTSIYELTQADTTYQGNTVQIVGEVVGDNVRAEEDPGKRWITLEAIEEDHESSISVLVNEDDISLIDTYGGYNRKGTTLQVRGTFYLACPSHEGIFDIHAESVTLVAKGAETVDVFYIEQLIPGILLCALGIGLSVLYHFLRERER